LVRRGCTVDELHRLVRDGLARAEPMTVQGKRPSPADFYLRISDAGRKALAREKRRKWSVRLALLFLLGLLAGVCVAAFLTSHR
jgi:DNA-binding PadR family transcriptional regulator